MRIGSLFSGYGGLDLACEAFFGATTAWHADNDPAASKVLAHHWPDVPNLGDITAVDWSAVEPVDIITGGFPCQDVSAAGRRAGIADGTRSGLWAHMLRAVTELRPRYVVIENVRGLLSARAHRPMEPTGDALGNAGGQSVLRALGAVLGDLSDIGYDAQWVTVPASAVDACHRRERVFILATPAGTQPDRWAETGIETPPRDDADRRGDPTADAHGDECSRKRDEWPRRAAPAGGRQGDVRPPLLPTPSAADGNGGGRMGSAGQQTPLPGAVLLLPTPSVADGTGGHATRSGSRADELLLPGVARAHATGALMPTPRASDGTKGGPNQRGSSGDLMLPSAVVRLLPTPESKLASSGPDYARMKRAGSGGHDLATAIAIDTDWGQYATAVARQAARSRPAPPPTEPNTKGNPRLSALFPEWMMYLRAGWVTDLAIGLTRNEMLKVIGNGVVPPQAFEALCRLWPMQWAAAA